MTNVDYTLYLVTDSTPAILKDRSLVEVVEAAVKGGATIVQYRKKTGDTADLIREAQALHKVTKKHGVPLVINDRVDVAVAVGCEGIHIGQDDIDIDAARKILKETIQNPIIGVTASSVDEAVVAAKAGATYLGLGTVYATPTKQNTKSIVGPSGIRQMLAALHKENLDIPTVCIGGINASNAQLVLYQSRSEHKELDGVAVVSALIAAEDPEASARNMREKLRTPPAFAVSDQSDTLKNLDIATVYDYVPKFVDAVVAGNPLCHNMTNTVVQNFAANVALAIGGSPIMASYGKEATDLSKLGGSLVINMGTVTPEGLQDYLIALKEYNAVGGPVLFDPVGGGATQIRRDAVKQLMAGGYFTLIKGNEGEIKTVAGVAGLEQQRGVDSGHSTLSISEKTTIAEDLAKRERCVVLMSGETDILTDGSKTVLIRNGHRYMGSVTGAGCTLGTTIAAFLAMHKQTPLLAALAAVLLFEIAAELAAEADHVRGPGSFIPAWIDSLYDLAHGTSGSRDDWIKRAKLEFRSV